jgi:hypothetical protein
MIKSNSLLSRFCEPRRWPLISSSQALGTLYASYDSRRMVYVSIFIHSLVPHTDTLVVYTTGIALRFGVDKKPDNLDLFIVHHLFVILSPCAFIGQYPYYKSLFSLSCSFQLRYTPFWARWRCDLKQTIVFLFVRPRLPSTSSGLMSSHSLSNAVEEVSRSILVSAALDLR